MAKKRVRITCPLNPTGVGIHAQHLCRALIDLENDQDYCDKFEFYINPTGMVMPSVDLRTASLIGKKLMHQDVSTNLDVEIVLDVPSKCDSIVQSGNVDTLAKTFAYTVFETDFSKEPNSPLKGKMESLAHWYGTILLPSSWAMSVVKRGIDEQYPCRLVPEGVGNLQIIDKPRENRPRDLVISSIGKFEKRKGHLVLLDALQRTSRRVQVHAYWTNFWNPSGIQKELSARKWHGYSGGSMDEAEVWSHGRTILYLHQRETYQHKVLESLKHCNLALYPHFSEGWGLPILESMASGIPTATTACGGAGTYTPTYYEMLGRDARDHLMIPQGDPKIAYDGKFFPGHDGIWWETDVENVLKVIEGFEIDLRAQHDDLFREAAARLQDLFSWKESAEKLLAIALQ